MKGDVHDIGKNIVGVVLGCNNYEVIDLGVMVPAATILDTAAAEQADIVGLSGLITPSLDEMVNVAAEMQRRGMTTPLLIGGATTSRQHTAVRVAPGYDGTTLHVLDASRVVGRGADLLDPARAADLDEANRAEQERLREQHESRRSQPLLPLDAARANRERLDFADRRSRRSPASVRSLPRWPTLRELIDWQFFFLAWELKGKFPAILEKLPAARAVRRRERAAGRDHRRRALPPRGGYGFWPAQPTATTSSWPVRTAVRLPDAAAADRQAGRPPEPVPGRLPGAPIRITSAGSRSPSMARTSWPPSTRRSRTTTRRSW